MEVEEDEKCLPLDSEKAPPAGRVVGKRDRCGGSRYRQVGEEAEASTPGAGNVQPGRFSPDRPWHEGPRRGGGRHEGCRPHRGHAGVGGR